MNRLSLALSVIALLIASATLLRPIPLSPDTEDLQSLISGQKDLMRRLYSLEDASAYLERAVYARGLAGRNSPTLLPATPGAAMAESSTEAAGGMEQGSPDSLILELDQALLDTRSSITFADVNRVLGQLVNPLVEGVEPALTEQQKSALANYITDGDGRRWLEKVETLNRYRERLSTGDIARIDLMEAEEFSKLMAHIRQSVLTLEQLKFFPYGRRYREGK